MAAVLFVLGLAPVAYASNYQTNILSYNPVSLWKLNEASGSIHDTGSNAYTATVSGTGQTYSVTGIEGGASPPTAISTTSSGSFSVSTSNPYNSVIDYNKPFLIEELVNIPAGALPSSGNKWFGMYATGTGTNWFWGVNNDAGNFREYFSPTSQSNGIACEGNGGNISAGANHHISMVYAGSSGNFSCADLIFYIDGVAFVGASVGGTTPGTGTWNNGTMSAVISAANNGTAVTAQDLAIYNVAYPSGSTSRLANSSNSPLDILSSYHAFLYQNNNAALANPGANPKLLFEKDCSDSDDWITFQYLMDGQYRGLVNLIGMAANPNSDNTHGNSHCASAMRSFLHYWNKDTSIPVGAYWGTNGCTTPTQSACDDGYSAVQTDFRPWDSTDVGIVGWTISGGTGYAVGDTFSIVGGTLETHDTTTAATFKVLTVSSGVPQTIRPYYATPTTLQSYSTAPNCSTPCATTTLSGGGSGLTFTAITTAANYGNFPNAEWMWTDLIAANPGVYIANGGTSGLDVALAASHTSTVNSNVAALILMQCELPSTAYWSAGMEFNCGLLNADWTTVASDLTIPRIYVGIENTSQIGSGPVSGQGWIYGGFPNVSSHATIPGQDGMYNSSTASASGHGSGSCQTFPSLACYRTFWDMWVYWIENQGSNPASAGKQGWMLWAGGNNATMAYTASTNTFSATSGGNAYFLRRTQESAINSDIVTIMAETPSSCPPVCTNNEGSQIPLKGAANDNDASKRFAQALFSEWDAAIFPSFRSKRLAAR